MLGKLIPIVIIVLVIWVLFFHRSIPGLGRRTGRRLRDVGDAGREILDGEEVPGSPLARYEHQAGKAVTARILAEHPLAADRGMQDRVLRIGRAIAGASSRREVRYRFAVLEGEEPNAMAVPGGSIFLTRGLVELCLGDDDRLAGLIGHEVAHIDCRHAVKSYAARAAANAGVRLLTLGRGAIVSTLAGGVRNMLEEGYSRDRELEADCAGSELAARAGFDRGGLAAFLRDLLERRPLVAGAPLETLPFFRTHPPLAERISALGTVPFSPDRGTVPFSPDTRKPDENEPPAPP